MPHSYTSSLLHCVWSTKGRQKLIDDGLASHLWPYLGGIARQNRIRALAVGGVEDHVHLLLSTPSTLTVAKAVQLVKGGSSKWVHERFPLKRGFAWQEGYAAFSVSASHAARTIEYVRRQREHHRRMSFEEEYIEFLRRHGIRYDERYVFD